MTVFCFSLRALLGLSISASFFEDAYAITALVREQTGWAKHSDRSHRCTLPEGAQWCTVQLKNLPAFSMAVYAESDIVSDSICGSGTWEVEDMADFGPPGQALDIGGNIGFFSLALAHAGWDVLTFEPLAKNVEMLKASLCRNPALAKRVKIRAGGLGESASHCQLISDNANVGDGITRCGTDAEKPVPDNYAVRGEFDVHRLDDVLAEEAVQKIDFVKIDVEGYECKVFGGGPSLFSKFRPKLIQSEVWPEMQGCNPSDYLASFKKADYVIAKDVQCHSHAEAEAPQNIENFWMCSRGGKRNSKTRSSLESASSLLQVAVSKSGAPLSTLSPDARGRRVALFQSL